MGRWAMLYGASGLVPAELVPKLRLETQCDLAPLGGGDWACGKGWAEPELRGIVFPRGAGERGKFRSRPPNSWSAVARYVRRPPNTPCPHSRRRVVGEQ